MDRRMFPTVMRRLVLPGAVAAIGAVLWFMGPGRREPSSRVVWVPLWPRPDGSVRSFGEVWDHPQIGGHDAP